MDPREIIAHFHRLTLAAAANERESLATVALDVLLPLVEAERGGVFLTGAGGQALALVKARTFDREDLARETDLAMPVAAKQAAELGRRIAGLEPVLVALPLVVGVHTLGAVYLENRMRKEPFDQEKLALTEALVDHAALAVEAVELRLSRENSAPAAPAREVPILGVSRRIRELRDLLPRIAESELPVLITGESGTGKEHLARTIHALGPRREARFVALDCAAMGGSLLESELFGHVRGAFTGAVADREGLFQEAHKGTLFLDSIGELEPGVQARLLRVLEDKEIRPVGGSANIKVDVRVVASTRKDLDQAVRERRFRQDLLFRLRVLRVEIPPLRERREDVPHMVAHFARIHLGEGAYVEPEALRLLSEYDWPGNVRELENEFRRLAALGERRVRVAVLSPTLRGGGPRPDAAQERVESYRAAMDQYEARMLLSVLTEHGWNISSAARALRVDRMKLARRLKKLGLEPRSLSR